MLVFWSFFYTQPLLACSPVEVLFRFLFLFSRLQYIASCPSLVFVFAASEEGVAQKLKKQHQDWKFDLDSLSEVLGGKIDSEVGAVKRQVERSVSTNLCH
jgi:hypothetical protein